MASRGTLLASMLAGAHPLSHPQGADCEYAPRIRPGREYPARPDPPAAEWKLPSLPPKPGLSQKERIGKLLTYRVIIGCRPMRVAPRSLPRAASPMIPAYPGDVPVLFPLPPWSPHMKFKPLLGTDMSGKLGGIVASHNTYGAYFRRLVKPVNRKTLAMQAQRSALAYVSQLWRTLGATLLALWSAAAVTKTSRKGDRVTLTGQAAFMFVNLLRRRIGLAQLSSPPSSTPGAALTPPTVAFASSTTLTVTFTAADEWNAAQGGVIISAALLTSSGKTYANPNLAVDSLIFPAAAANTVTLPFAVPIGARVRLSFHATGPDGRQSTYVTVDATNPSFAPPAPLSRTVISVTAIGTTHALWLFDGPVTVTPGAETAFEISATPSLSVAQGGPNGVDALYTGISSGGTDPYLLSSQPTTVTETILVPQSGSTV